MMQDNAAMREKIWDLVLDLIREKMKKYSQLEGKLCKECPILAELIREINLARLQDREENVDELRDYYGL